MKTTTKSILVACGLMAVLASCSNDINTPNKGDKGQSKGLQFSFTEEGYGEDEMLSRAAANKAPQTETVDLGDCEAEVSVENDPDTTSHKTRAITNKHYTIRAYQAGVKKAEIRGIFNGATFTTDSDSPRDMQLTKGQTYDFLAFNDDVTPAGENLTVDESKMQTARIASFTTTITEQKMQQINFEMKHVCARLRTQFVCQKHIPENITATLEETASNVIPTAVSYNISTKAYTATATGTMPSKNCNSLASTEEPYTASNGGQTFAYTSTSDYHYFMPTTSGSNLKLTFNAGTVFWKPISGAIPKLNETLSMQPNKSYVVKIKLKPRFTYLFTDGTTGFFSETKQPGSTKKVIGVVVGQGRAVGVHQGYASFWDSGLGMYYDSKRLFTTTSTDFNTCVNDMKGYEYCWTTTYNLNNPDYGAGIRANIWQLGHIFQASRYSQPGISPTPWMQAHKWYLPAYGEYKLIFDNIGFGDYTQLQNNNVPANLVFDYQAPWYGYIAQSAFSQVPNGRLALNYYYASSTETTGSLFAEPYLSTTNFRWAGSGDKGNRHYTYLCLSFIKYE